MPSLGADMDAGTLVEWKVKPGDRVKKGDLIATVETVKGAIEIEIFEEGVIAALLVQPGATVPVNTPLARLERAAPSAAEATVERPPPAPAAPAPPPAPAAAASPTAPAAAPPAASAPPAHHFRASPVARRVAAERGVDLSQVVGTGPQGAIVREDVERAAAGRGPAPAARVEPAPARFTPDAMRGAISAAIARSKREIPHYYLSTEIDLAASLAWLDGYNERRAAAERLLPAALLLKAAALAAREVPELNGHYLEGVFQPAGAVRLGVAINLRGGGLIAPAIADADRLPLPELMSRLAGLVERARAGGLRASELAPPSITVTNLGDQGVTAVFPIIHPPQVAMVGFGKVVSRAWVVDGMVGPRPVVVASLAADHRVSDGHRGARFLAAIARLLQHPEAL
jgi:pyruvate dehydrogenase E2 component (dihydrolipoamide acetyltransferase)